MPPSAFYPNADLAELGPGSQLSLFGFRACAMGHVQCCCVVKTYQEVFGRTEGGPMLGATLQLARHLGNDGSRRLKLSTPGCIRFTHDETSILGALAAAQSCDQNLRDAHLSWLLTCPPQAGLCKIVDFLADGFLRRELEICLPQASVTAQVLNNFSGLGCVGQA